MRFRDELLPLVALTALVASLDVKPWAMGYE
jgi:hypothetical protein